MSVSTNNDLTQLHQLEARFAAAFNSKNVDDLMTVYAPGEAVFAFDVVGPPSAHLDWNAYREAWTHAFASMRGEPRFQITDLDVHVSGDFAYGRSLQHVSAIRDKDGKPLEYTVRVTDVYRRIDGKWLIVQEHASFPTDRTTFTPLLDSSIEAFAPG